jgi:hypothetical protein
MKRLLPVLAPLRHADQLHACLFIEVQPKGSVHAQTTRLTLADIGLSLNDR